MVSAATFAFYLIVIGHDGKSVVLNGYKDEASCTEALASVVPFIDTRVNNLICYPDPGDEI